MPNQMLPGPGKGPEDKRNAAVGSKIRAKLRAQGIDPKSMTTQELAQKYPGEFRKAHLEASKEVAPRHGFGSGTNSALEFMQSQTT